MYVDGHGGNNDGKGDSSGFEHSMLEVRGRGGESSGS